MILRNLLLITVENKKDKGYGNTLFVFRLKRSLFFSKEILDMLGKEVWKYFLFFLLFVAIAFFIYILYKLSENDVEEGFQVRGDFFQINPLTSWDQSNQKIVLSLPKEFEAKKKVYTGIRTHYYIGTIDVNQQSNIGEAEYMFASWALAVDKNYKIDPKRLYMAWDFSSTILKTAPNAFNTGNREIPVGAKELRRLNQNLADILVQKLYNDQLMGIKNWEYGSFTYTCNDNMPGVNEAFSSERYYEDKIRKKVAHHVKNEYALAPRLVNNKYRNLYLTTYVMLLDKNPDAAREYLNTFPEAQKALNDSGAYVEQKAVELLQEKVMEKAMLKLGSVTSKGAKAVKSLKNLKGVLSRLKGGVMKKFLSQAAKKGLKDGMKAMKYASKIKSALQGGKNAAKIGSSVGRALRAAKTAASFSNPLGAIMGLLDLILSLIPKSKWIEMGTNKANEQIRDQMLKCPTGYMEADSLDIDTFNTILDVLPIPAGFGTMQKAMMKKLSCIKFDEDGVPEPKDKVQCVGGEDQFIRSCKYSRGPGPKGWIRPGEWVTCFADPDPPIQLYPIEPVAPVFDSVEDTFKALTTKFNSITNTTDDLMVNKLNTIYFFPDAWPMFQNPGSLANLQTNISKGIRDVVYVNPIVEYNTESTESQLNAVDVPANAADNFDFWFGDDTGTEAMNKFISASVADRQSKAYFLPKQAFIDKFIAEVKDIYKYDIYMMKLGLPEIFSPNDTKEYEIQTEENVTHTIFLDSFRKELSLYCTKQAALSMRYPVLLDEYNKKLAGVMAEITDLKFTPEFLDSLAQYLYEECYKVSDGNTMTFIDRMYSACIVCDNYITIVCSTSCITKEKGPKRFRNPTPAEFWNERKVRMEYPLGYDDSIGIDFYLKKEGGVWKPTAWGRPDPSENNTSFCFAKLPRIVKLDYTPTYVYKFTKYNNTKCNDPKTLQQQLEYYKQVNPNKNIKAIVGQATKDPLNCVMQWTETDYNPVENTEGSVSTKSAIFTYENPYTPYPFNEDGTPIPDIYKGFTMTTSEKVTQINPPIVQAIRGLPPEQSLAGPCETYCYDPNIMKAIIEKYNENKDPEGGNSKIVNIKKIFTAKPNSCDFVANVNTAKGVIEEQRRRAIVSLQTSTPKCKYTIDSIGAKDSGTFVTFTEGFTAIPVIEKFQGAPQSPYPGYFYQSTTVNSPTQPKYNFGDNILGSMLGSVQGTFDRLTQAGTDARYKTFATIGTNTTLEGCSNTRCSSDEIMNAIAAKFNGDNWGKTRMNKILKIATASPLECDVVFEDANISGSNRYVETYNRDRFNGRPLNLLPEPVVTYSPAGSGWSNTPNFTWNARFTMRKIPNTCKFEAVSFKYMTSNISTDDLENTSQPIFTANPQSIPLKSPKQTSNLIGCGTFGSCSDNNMLVEMVQAYKTANKIIKFERYSVGTQLIPSARKDDEVRVIGGMKLALPVVENISIFTINRLAKISRTQCLVEFQLDIIDPATKERVFDTMLFEFTPNQNDEYRNIFSSNPDGKCVWKIKSMTRDDQVPESKYWTHGLNGANPTNFNPYSKSDLLHLTGKSKKLDNLKATVVNIKVNTLKYISPQCPTTIPDVNCKGSNAQIAAQNYFNLFTGTSPQITKAVSVNNRTCEFKLADNSYTRVSYIPNSQCSGYIASGATPISKADSLLEGWENTKCYPIDCTKDTYKTMSQNYIQSVPYSYKTGENTITIKRIAQVNSNTCEYQVTTSNGILMQRANEPFNPIFHKRVEIKSFGDNCDTRVISVKNIEKVEDSLTFNQAFSCPSFDPMSLFTGNPRVTSLSLLQSTLRSQFLNTNIFSTNATPASTFDRVNGPSIRSRDGLTVVRGKLLPANPTSKSLKAEFEIKIFVNLSRPNSETYPFTLSLAKIGTLITQAANQVDWTDYNNQFRVDPKNTWGPRRPPAEFRPEGVYEFSQDMFSTWQPIFHPVIEIQFPNLDCNTPSIRDSKTNNMYNLTLVPTKEQSILV
jgi:hypothetical protein